MRRLATAVLLAMASAVVPLSASGEEPVRGMLVSAPGSPYSVGMTPYSMVLEDLDVDGDLDIATANTNGSGISVLLGDGDGGFTPAPGSPFAAAHAAELRVGFVNGDALPDLVSIRKEPNCCGNTDLLLTLLGTGGGAFASALEGPVIGPMAGDGLTLGDFTGDGVLDAAYTNTYVLSETHQHVIGILEGAGNGGWSEIHEYVERELPYPLTNPSSAVEAADVDDDTDLDLVVANNGTKDVSVWRNDGTGAFTRASGSPHPLGKFTGDVRLADVDEDGDVDILVGNLNYNSVSLLLGDGTGAFASAGWSPIAVPTGAADLDVADIDGDGHVDLVSGYGAFRLMMGDGTGHFVDGWGTSYTAPNLSDLAVGDLDGDGYADLVQTNNSLDQVAVWLSVLDSSPPTTTIQVDPPEPLSGWYDAGVTVGALTEDIGPAGVAGQRCVVDPVTPPSAYGDMTGSCFSSFSLTGDGVHHVYAAGVDRLGNEGVAVEQTVRIDSQPPGLAPTVEPDVVVLGETAVASAHATDELSGVDLASCEPVDTSTAGGHTVMCTALDVAGNESVAEAAYTVVPQDAEVEVAAARAPGTLLALDVTVTSNTALDVGDLTVALPPSLRFDSASGVDGCSEASGLVTCSVGVVSTDPVSVTVLVAPGGPGPHQVPVSIAPDDALPGNDDVEMVLDPSLVCDNVATSGPDRVVGTVEADILCGLGDDDVLRGLAGDDLMFGGPGLDSVSYAGASGTAVDLRLQGAGEVGAWARDGSGDGMDSFTGIERALGGDGADLLIGDERANRLRGSAGDDVLRGLAAADGLEGGPGADRLVGGDGVDTLVGGAGTDSCRDRADHRISCES